MPFKNFKKLNKSPKDSTVLEIPKKSIGFLMFTMVAMFAFSVYSHFNYINTTRDLMDEVNASYSNLMNGMNYSAMLEIENDGYVSFNTNINTVLLVKLNSFEQTKEEEALIDISIGNPMNIAYEKYAIYFYFYDKEYNQVYDYKYNTNEIINSGWNQTRFFLPEIDSVNCKYVEIAVEVGEIELQ